MAKRQQQLASGTVMVGCKMPNGLFLDLIDENGGRERFGELKGYAHDAAQPSQTMFGYAMTAVDETKMAAWMEQNKDSPILKDGLVFVQDTADRAEDEAKDRRKVPQQSAPISAEEIKKAGVETADEQPGEARPMSDSDKEAAEEE